MHHDNVYYTMPLQSLVDLPTAENGEANSPNWRRRVVGEKFGCGLSNFSSSQEFGNFADTVHDTQIMVIVLHYLSNLVSMYVCRYRT